MQDFPYTAREGGPSQYTQARTKDNDILHLVKRKRIPYNKMCGAAEGCCVGGVVTCAGSGVRQHPGATAFLFSIPYYTVIFKNFKHL